MLSDQASDNYPTVLLCDRCVEEYKRAGDHDRILEINAYDSDYGDVCASCDKSVAEEEEEKQAS